jgi:hypothetical protein
MATKLLDYKVTWVGLKPNDTQALEWPRGSVYDEDGYLLSSTTIPVFLKDATFEMALSLLVEDRMSDYTEKKLSKIKAGPIQLDFTGEYDRKLLPDLVMEMIQFYGSYAVRGGLKILKLERS